MTALAGPIAITGASGQVGKALVSRLGRLPNELRLLERGDELAPALRDAGAVVHLAGTLQPRGSNGYVRANLETVRRTVVALEGSAVDRVVFLSYVGADSRSPNEYLRAKGRAEDLLYGCGRNIVILRCSHIFGPPEQPGPTIASWLAKPRASARVLGNGRQLLAPVYLGDVVEAIVRALDPSAPVGRFDLVGPETMTLDDLVRAVNGGAAEIRHVHATLARALGHALPRLTPALVDVLLSDSVGERGRAERAFGLEARRRVCDVYSQLLSVAAQPAPAEG